MRRRGWWIAIVLVLLTNLIVFTGVLRNRSGEAEMTIELTERELPFSYQGDEDSGMALYLDYGDFWLSDWLDKTKMEDLGFDCSVPPNAEAEEFHYEKQLPRRGFLVLELGGDAWQRWLERQHSDLKELEGEHLENRQRTLEIERLTRTRFFPVDAGADPEALRDRYPDRQRYVILPAVFDITVRGRWNSETGRREQPRIGGRISQKLVHNIHVSLPLSEQLGRLRDDRLDRSEVNPFEEPEKFDPRYAVILKVGSRYEPWIDSVRIAD